MEAYGSEALRRARGAEQKHRLWAAELLTGASSAGARPFALGTALANRRHHNVRYGDSSSRLVFVKASAPFRSGDLMLPLHFSVTAHELHAKASTEIRPSLCCCSLSRLRRRVTPWTNHQFIVGPTQRSKQAPHAQTIQSC